MSAKQCIIIEDSRFVTKRVDEERVEEVEELDVGARLLKVLWRMFWFESVNILDNHPNSKERLSTQLNSSTVLPH